MRKHLAVTLGAMLSLIVTGRVFAQSYLTQAGSPAFTVADSAGPGFVNVSNGNLHIEIPITSSPQRGSVPYVSALIYDSRIWRILDNGTSKSWQPDNISGSQGGWRFGASGSPGTVTYNRTSQLIQCGNNRVLQFDYANFIWTAPDGTAKSFAVNLLDGCPYRTATYSFYDDDTTGYRIDVTFHGLSQPTSVVFAPNGAQMYPTVKDVNGNFYSADANGNVIDTLGRTPVLKTVSGSQTFYDVLDARNSSTRPRFTVITTTVAVSTAFGQSGVTEYSGNLTVISSIVLPDLSSYSFQYEPNYGSLSSATLRTGGQVTYVYSTFQDSQGNRNRWVHTKSLGGGTWTYDQAVVSTCTQSGQICQQKITLTKPSTDQCVYVFSLINGAWVSTQQDYTGSAASGTLLKTTATDYIYDAQHPVWVQASRVTTTNYLPNNATLTKKTEYTYDNHSYGNIAALKEWKYYTNPASPPANPDRETDTTYKTDTAYINANIINLPTSVKVTDGAATPTKYSETLVSYDDPASLTSVTGIAHHDDTNFGASYLVRGNPTQTQRWVSGTTYLTTKATYDTTGQLRSSIDSANNTTSYSYNDTFFHDNGSNPPQTASPAQATNAYLTQITAPLIGSQNIGYYLNTGQRASVQDVNGNNAYNHYLDSLNRPTHGYGPLVSNNRAWALVQYTSQTVVDAYSTVTDTSASSTCTSCVHNQTTLDTFGRITQSQIVNDPDPAGATKVDQAYDSSGRVQSVSTPYRSTSDTTYGTQSLSYDGLDRTTQVNRAGGSIAYSYFGAQVTNGGGAASQLCSSGTYGLGYPMLGKDEASRKRQSWVNGLGQLIEVDEPDASNGMTVNTCYTYDPAGRLTQVTQGSENRTFSYDGLSRITSATMPEAGTVSTSFTKSGGGLCAGNPAAPCFVTKATNVVVTYSYDALSRLTGKSYSDPTPTSTYYYDQNLANGLTITNGKGRRTSMTDASSTPTTVTWSYDANGNVLTEKRTIAGQTKITSYGYNLNGSLASITYPSGKIVAYSPSSIGRVTAVTDNTDSQNPINYVSSATYAPPGMLSGYKNGGTQASPLLTTSNSFNSRLQPIFLSAAKTSATVFSLGYDYHLASGDNGQVLTITNNLPGASGRSQTYTYDNLGRLASAVSQATSGADCWGQDFVYDRYANLLTVSAHQCTVPTLSVSDADHNNRIDQNTFNANGETTNDGTNALAWDGEGRLTSAAGVNYTYDGDNLRVKKSSDKLYWRSISGDVLSETDLSGNITNEFIYFAGQRMATLDPTTPTAHIYYHFRDHLGTAHIIVKDDGTVCYDADYYPFGGERPPVTNICSFTNKFTNYEHDSESGLKYAYFRYYSTTSGRFVSPDLLSGRIGEPQSLNRYSFVLNDPMNLVDPRGLTDCGIDDQGNYVCHTTASAPEDKSPVPEPFGHGSNDHPITTPPNWLSWCTGFLLKTARNNGAAWAHSCGNLGSVISKLKAFWNTKVPPNGPCKGTSLVVSESLSANFLIGGAISITGGVSTQGLTISITPISGAAGVPQAAYSGTVGFEDMQETAGHLDLNFWKTDPRSWYSTKQPAKIALTVPLSSNGRVTGMELTTGFGGPIVRLPVNPQYTPNNPDGSLNYCLSWKGN